jgi:hypothetical protein
VVARKKSSTLRSTEVQCLVNAVTVEVESTAKADGALVRFADLPGMFKIRAEIVIAWGQEPRGVVNQWRTQMESPTTIV